MRVLLRPRRELTFGQDHRAAAVADRLSFTVIDVADGSYRMQPGASSPALIVSFNSHQRADVSFADRHPNVPLVVHVQLRPSFFDPDVRESYGMASREEEENLLRRASCVVVPARFMLAELAREYGITSARCIRNGVDTQLFRPPYDTLIREYRADLGIPEGVFVLAFIGQLSNAKGWQLLKEIAVQLPPRVFLVARSLPNHRKRLKDLQALNPDQIRVQVEGNEDRRRLPTRYSDALLITSLCEVAPLVSFEALASGVPVISTDCTPFFGELAADGLGEEHVSLFALPPGTSGRSHGSLRLDPEQAKKIANQMTDRLRGAVPLRAPERLWRSEKAKAAGVRLDRMLEDYESLYHEVADSGLYRPTPTRPHAVKR